MTPRRRWLVNWGIALAGCLAIALLFAVGALIRDALSGYPLHLDYVPAALLVGLWLLILIAVPVIAFLALVELLWRWIPARRLSAIVLRAAVLSLYGLATQADQLGSFTPSAGLLLVPSLGGGYGALIRLPSTPPMAKPEPT